MNAQTPLPAPPSVSFFPETAPFSEEQRAWLNGFFAGMLMPQGAPTALSAAENAALMPAEVDDGAPWHDAAMPMDERMKLAEGRPLPRRMMAAMAKPD
jgi:sulfite reductase (NADPH) flavoprotein alpha-component